MHANVHKGDLRRIEAPDAGHHLWRVLKAQEDTCTVDPMELHIGQLALQALSQAPGEVP